jgi:hypothetical protein
VISLTSDTAILAMAAVTRKMLSELVIREILCKPAVLTIGRKEQNALPVPKTRKLKAAKQPRLGKQE